MQKTLIILPGWGGNKETWKKFVDMARKEYNVEVIELPCFGDEPCPSEVWGVEDYSKFVESKVKGYGSEVVLLGHSFGGQVATYFTANNLEVVDKLIFSAPAVFRPKRKVTRLLFNLVAKIGKVFFKIPYIEKFSVFARKCLYKLAKSPDYAKTSGIKTEIFKKIIRQDLTEIIPNIKTKTLIVWGTLDKYLPVSDGKKLAKLLPNSKLEIIKRGKHGLHIQQPENLLKIIKDFLG